MLSRIGTELSADAARHAYIGLTEISAKGIAAHDKDSAQDFGIAAIIIGLLQFFIACLHAGLVSAFLKYGTRLGAECLNRNDEEAPAKA